MWAAGFFGSWSDIRLNRLFVQLSVVFTQRMADEFLVKINPAKIRMADELNTVEVVSFAFQPISARPHWRQASYGRVVFRYTALYPQAMEPSRGGQMIDHRKSRLGSAAW